MLLFFFNKKKILTSKCQKKIVTIFFINSIFSEISNLPFKKKKYLNEEKILMAHIYGQCMSTVVNYLLRYVKHGDMSELDVNLRSATLQSTSSVVKEGYP